MVFSRNSRRSNSIFMARLRRVDVEMALLRLRKASGLAFTVRWRGGRGRIFLNGRPVSPRLVHGLQVQWLDAFAEGLEYGRDLGTNEERARWQNGGVRV